MSLFDLVLILIIAGFGLFGFWVGFVHALGSLVGTILGVYLASHYYTPVADWLIQTTGWGGNFPKVLVFILAFVIINRLVGLAFYFIDKVLSIVTRLPFISSINRLLGLLFGILEGALVLGIVFYFINKFPLGPQFMTSLGNSKVAPYVIGFASFLWPLIPGWLTSLNNSLKNLNI